MHQDAEASGESSDFSPLTAEQAKALRERQPVISPWWVVLGQVVVGVLVSAFAWLLSGKVSVAESAAFGALAVVFPAAVFARGVTGRFASLNVGSAVLSFFVWELVKIVSTIALLFVARWVVSDLSWLAMLVGLILTMKVYWLALAVKPKAPTVLDKTLNGESN
jgi:ATP synthase protein I